MLPTTQPYTSKSIMDNETKRPIHIVFGIPTIVNVHGPFEQIPNYAAAVRFVFLPVILLSGLWMWKGHVLRRAG